MAHESMTRRLRFHELFMSELSKEDRIHEYIATMRQHFATYHNHKEQMAYVATALYLTGASTLFFQKTPQNMDKLSYQCLIIPLVVIFSIAAIKFVKWQLHLRATATDIIAACDLLRLRWLLNPPVNLDPQDFFCKKYEESINMPKFLYDEMPKVPTKGVTFLPKFLMLGTMSAAFLILILRLVFY
jgi:hypothetical protein